MQSESKHRDYFVWQIWEINENAGCSSSYIGETCRHFKTRIEEHIKKDNKSHIFKHLHSTATCFDSYNSLCFKIIDKANSKFDLKLKKLYILIGENLT